MAWTYSGDPDADDKDKVRFLVRDTDGSDQLLNDEEVLWAIASEGSVFRAAALLCEQISAKFSRSAGSKQVGDLRLDFTQRAKEYTGLAKSYRLRAAMGAVPFAGGISIAGKEGYENDTDRVAPAFTRSGFNHPELGSSTGST